MKLYILPLLLLLSGCSSEKVEESWDGKEIATFFSFEAVNLNISLDSVNLHTSKQIDSIIIAPKWKFSRDYFLIPKDSIYRKDGNLVGYTLKYRDRPNYFIIDTRELTSLEKIRISDLPIDSLKLFVKSRIKQDYYIYVYGENTKYRSEFKDTSKIILKRIYWGVD